MAEAQNQNHSQEQDIHQLLKVRREKLAALQESGKDPFQIMKYAVGTLMAMALLVTSLLQIRIWHQAGFLFF